MGLAEANMALWTCHTLPSTTTLASVKSSSVNMLGMFAAMLKRAQVKSGTSRPGATGCCLMH